MAKKFHGKTAGGLPITDALTGKLADKAEAGYDVEETLRRRVGQPPIGSAAASVGPCLSNPSRSKPSPMQPRRM